MANKLKLISPGERFRKLEVIRRVENHPKQGAQYECLCDCGDKKIVCSSDLRSGKVNSCGCLMGTIDGELTTGKNNPNYKGGFKNKGSEAWAYSKLGSVKKTSKRNGYSGPVGTRQEVLELWKECNGRCIICKVPEIECNEALHLDHCHETGELRGFLCSKCNMGLGLFRDCPDLLDAAKEYLILNQTTLGALAIMSYAEPRIGTTTPTRQRTPALWRGTLERYADSVLLGTFRSDDFKTPFTTAYTTTTAAVTPDGHWIVGDAGAGSGSGVFSTTTDPDGTVELTGVNSANVDWEGSQAQAGGAETQGENIVLPTHATDPRGTVVYETRVFLDATLNDTFFIGLAEPDMAATALLGATGVLTDAADYIGFYRLDGGDLQFVVRNDNAGVTAVEYNVDVVAAADIPDVAWVKLGFRVNADNQVEVYVDEVKKVKTSDTVADIVVPSTALPIENLTRKLVVLRGATGDNDPVEIESDWSSVNVAE